MIDIQVSLLVLIPAIGSILSLFTKRPEKVATWSSLIASLLSILIAALTFLQKVDYEKVYYSYGPIEIGWYMDAASALVGMLIAIVGFCSIMESLNYISPNNKEHPITSKFNRYYSLMLLFMSSALGFVFSSSLTFMIIFFELTSLCSWGLISFYETEEAKSAGLIAFTITHIAAFGLYAATGIIYYETGSVDLRNLSSLPSGLKLISLIGLLIASWGKGAQFPFHVWLPRAMSAPTPVSAYLHAAALVKLGAFLAIRTMMWAGSIPNSVAYICAIFAVITMLYSLTLYFPQTDIKKLLAYSTISQLSYIFTGVSLIAMGSKLAIIASVLYIFAHGFGKGLFFLTAGAISLSSGTRDLREIKGLIKKQKASGIGFTVATATITGVPPFGCFWGKLLLILSAVQLGSILSYTLAVIMIAESFVAFIWMLRWLTSCVWGEPSEKIANSSPLGLPTKTALYLLVTLSTVSAYIALPVLLW
ncbi:hydrogenase 4 subunit D [Fervidicoccus fontis]|uniref:Component HyfD of membrane-bound [Ni,Fe]-hydrogenase n=2 Tax=Fervidicoccus fontis TaxID=683846 RepID=I0A2R4_FERFK|nr:hydrogenase 4 subunit D [Fervidicoccus fontis]AFH43271.1 Component HyfD of membrane-bound [Ni,Fe]-hydrogenase [Fervidicoccus fontis Kam940]PMB75802.1 MAG: monovalent cation/H+ antiporter subunit A [Fervidicoccus fontis]PMB76521.1 MAG: monovalent cation/H+ antiporter subunit A [Fervidicoccus fontis]HEW63875.1 hydrogenase 4 subunit D [Fervidicoccus fontis]